MKKILFVTGSGGHSAELLLLFDKFSLDNYSVEFMLENDDPLTKHRINDCKIYNALKTRGKNEFFLISIIRTLICTLQSTAIFFKSKPDVIVSAGPGIAIPISYISKIFGKKIIFIESWSRVTTKSIAGNFIYPIADRFYVQWPEMKKIYPKSIFAGRLG